MMQLHSQQTAQNGQQLRKSARTQKKSPEADFYLGALLQAQGYLKEAVVYYQKAINRGLKNAALYSNLGLALSGLGQYKKAVETLRLALRAEPGFISARQNLGVVLQAMGQLKEAKAAYKQVLSMQPNHVEALLNLGVVLQEENRLDEAAESFRRILSIEPGNSVAHNNIGVLMMGQGRLTEAKESFRRAITINPDFSKALFHYVQAMKITRGDETLIAHLEDLAGRPELGAQEKSDVYFALGKCYDDLGDYEKAFLNYDNGHQLERRKYPFDPKQFVNEISGLIATFDKQFFAQRSTLGNPSEVPIFIVGMLRSGTTLVEQIISSHPAVFGAGELDFLDNRQKEMSLDSIKQLAPKKVLALADEYLAHLRTLSPGTLHVTDKMPQNFLHLGLIRLCFPHARIIHCKRNPLDTCLSIYFQKFAAPHPYAHELNNLALYYAQYERLMQHWKEVLPGKMLEVQYEDLITNQDATTRKIIEFCNLEWDDKCLAFDRNERAVHTASSWQVRQPMFSSSIGRWKHYQQFLGPLLQLGEADGKP